MEQCHDIGEEQRQGIGVGAAIRDIHHVVSQGQSNVREYVHWFLLPQLGRATIHDAVFASKGTQCLIARMPLT